MAKDRVFSIYEREAFAPPPEGATLRRLYTIAFGWDAPEDHGDRDIIEALRRVLDVPAEGKR